MKKFTSLLLLILLCTSSALAWDNRGHSTVAYIAERHLTPRAKSNIERYIGNRSITYYASWMDYNRTDPPYDVTHDWHVDYWTNDMRTDAQGNALPPVSTSNLKRIVEEMSDYRSLSDSLVNLHIKCIVHMVGDIHCPVHINFADSRPMRVKEGKKTLKVHAMWDARVLASKHDGTSPMQLSTELDTYTAEQIAAIQKGTIDDWHNESVEYSKRAIEMIPQNKQVSYESYFNSAIEIAENRITVAGYRLAAILNSIFDK